MPYDNPFGGLGGLSQDELNKLLGLAQQQEPPVSAHYRPRRTPEEQARFMAEYGDPMGTQKPINDPTRPGPPVQLPEPEAAPQRQPEPDVAPPSTVPPPAAPSPIPGLRPDGSPSFTGVGIGGGNVNQAPPQPQQVPGSDPAKVAAILGPLMPQAAPGAPGSPYRDQMFGGDSRPFGGSQIPSGTMAISNAGQPTKFYQPPEGGGMLRRVVGDPMATKPAAGPLMEGQARGTVPDFKTESFYGGELPAKDMSIEQLLATMPQSYDQQYHPRTGQLIGPDPNDPLARFQTAHALQAKASAEDLAKRKMALEESMGPEYHYKLEEIKARKEHSQLMQRIAADQTIPDAVKPAIYEKMGNLEAQRQLHQKLNLTVPGLPAGASTVEQTAAIEKQMASLKDKFSKAAEEHASAPTEDQAAAIIQKAMGKPGIVDPQTKRLVSVPGGEYSAERLLAGLMPTGGKIAGGHAATRERIANMGGASPFEQMRQINLAAANRLLGLDEERRQSGYEDTPDITHGGFTLKRQPTTKNAFGYTRHPIWIEGPAGAYQFSPGEVGAPVGSVNRGKYRNKLTDELGVLEQMAEQPKK